MQINRKRGTFTDQALLSQLMVFFRYTFVVFQYTFNLEFACFSDPYPVAANTLLDFLRFAAEQIHKLLSRCYFIKSVTGHYISRRVISVFIHTAAHIMC